MSQSSLPQNRVCCLRCRYGKFEPPPVMAGPLLGSSLYHIHMLRVTCGHVVERTRGSGKDCKCALPMRDRNHVGEAWDQFIDTCFSKGTSVCGRCMSCGSFEPPVDLLDDV
jgi:hypothetical protein